MTLSILRLGNAFALLLLAAAAASSPVYGAEIVAKLAVPAIELPAQPIKG